MSDVNRRNFLRGALAAGAYLTLARSHAPARGPGVERRFAPVRVARNRIIREIVGLRPYRAEGFMVAAERVGEKLLVHNYGHGGAGITLSWGTASLAVDLARDFLSAQPSRPRRGTRPAGPRRFAVLGCGVSGLSTARLLQRRFQDGPGTVTIYAKDLPPETTSNIAGGFWSPTAAYDSQVASMKFTEQFRLACRISNRDFQLLVGPEYGVRWIDTLELYRSEAALARELPGGNDLYPQQEVHRDPERYFGFPFVRQYSTMLVEPPVYLNALLRDFYVAGGKLVVREFRGREEVMRLPEPIIFNCAGLGSRALFGDEKLGPVRGQLEVLLPQPEIDYCYLGGGYMFPRRDGIILGGTFDRDDWSLAPRAEQTTQILEGHAEVMKGLKG
ncbi:MAG TPA: FAD-dependent oxidoreductase [Pyrinomonadaceae bacterium]|nr:FAD-dependent oxidoreductase [Pyrinomonadaceae bacterium]